MKKIIYGILGAFAISGLTYLATYQYYQREIEFCQKNSELLDVIEIVENEFYLDVDEDELTYDMIKGVIDGLDDVFSFYHTSKQIDEIYVNTSITLQSSGFQIDKDRTGNILVTQVDENSRAEKMGLQTNDIITDINGINVIETGYYNIISELLGKDNTTMELSVLRGNDSFQITFIRENNIEEFSDVQSYVIKDDILYYRFNSFNESTVENFENSLNSAMETNDIKSVIFDLRENNGGIIKECVEFFDLFSGSGNQVREVYSKSGKENIYQTTDDVKYNFDVVLLVSEETKSSGEIFSALFQDTVLGTLVGTTTYGKGVFQNKRMLSDFTTYSIACGYYYVNDRENYNNIGITPDIEISMNLELIGTDDDIQLQKAVELLEK